MRILLVVAGIVVMFTGIWCVAFPGGSFQSIAFVLGCVMVFAGTIECGAYFLCPKKPEGFGWMLAESLLTFIAGCLVLSGQLVLDAMIPLFFGMWVMFGGVTRLTLALALGKKRDNAWLWVLLLGVLSTASGFYAFFNQIAVVLSLMSLLGIYFLLQGINLLVNGIIIPGKKRKGSILLGRKTKNINKAV